MIHQQKNTISGSPRLHQLRRQHRIRLAEGRDHRGGRGVAALEALEALAHGGLEERAALRGTNGFCGAAMEVELEISDLRDVHVIFPRFSSGKHVIAKTWGISMRCGISPCELEFHGEFHVSMGPFWDEGMMTPRMVKGIHFTGI